MGAAHERQVAFDTQHILGRRDRREGAADLHARADHVRVGGHDPDLIVYRYQLASDRVSVLVRMHQRSRRNLDVIRSEHEHSGARRDVCRRGRQRGLRFGAVHLDEAPEVVTGRERRRWWEQRHRGRRRARGRGSRRGPARRGRRRRRCGRRCRGGGRGRGGDADRAQRNRDRERSETAYGPPEPGRVGINMSSRHPSSSADRAPERSGHSRNSRLLAAGNRAPGLVLVDPRLPR